MAPATDERDTDSRPRLTRESVLACAIDIADEVGIEPLTLRKLAAALGVKPMSIYHHVANKDEILDGMVDTVFGEIELPPPDLDWKAAMRVRAVSAREVLARHRWAAGMLDSRTNPGPRTLRHHDAVLGCLRGGGFTVEMSAHAVALIDSYIYGFAIQEAALPFHGESEIADLAEELARALPADEYPNLVEFTFDHVLRPGYRFGDEFEFGLELVLEGLARALNVAPD